MTTLKMIKPEIIPGFDVLKWKQETQAEIYEEIKDMTTEEILEYFHKGSEEFQKELEQRRKEIAERQKAEGKK